MVVALDVQDLNVAKAAWQVVQTADNGSSNNDDQGNPFYETTLFKMPLTLFNSPDTFVSTFYPTYNKVNFIPVITTSAIAPRGAAVATDTEDAGFDVQDVAPGFGDEPTIISLLRQFETFNSPAPIQIPAVEVGLKEPGGILSSVLSAARTNMSTGKPMSIGQFNPVGEYYPPDNSNTSQTPQFYRSSNGTCCDVLTHYLYNNPDGKVDDDTQPYDKSDQRTDLGFIISSNNQYVITDAPKADPKPKN